jgi:hypothetical protein
VLRGPPVALPGPAARRGPAALPGPAACHSGTVPLVLRSRGSVFISRCFHVKSFELKVVSRSANPGSSAGEGAHAGTVIMVEESLVKVNAVKNAVSGMANAMAAVCFALFGDVRVGFVAPLAAGFLVRHGSRGKARH